MTEIGFLALAAIVVFLVLMATTTRGIGSLPVRAAGRLRRKQRSSATQAIRLTDERRKR
jgi:hypothetical protein